PSRRAPQHQKARRTARPVCEHAQDGKEIGAALYLVEHDQPTQWLERHLRLLEASEVARALQIEDGRVPGAIGERARHRALANLPRADQRDNRETAQQPVQLLEMLGPWKHGPW